MGNGNIMGMSREYEYFGNIFCDINTMATAINNDHYNGIIWDYTEIYWEYRMGILSW